MMSAISREDVGPCVITLDTFFAELLPSLKSSLDLVIEIERQLRASGELIFRNGTNAWRAMPIRPSRSKADEHKIFAGLVLVIQSIIREVALAKSFEPELVFQVALIPHINLHSNTTRPDGDTSVSSSVPMATLNNIKTDVPWWEQVLLSGEFQVTDWEGDFRDNAEQLLSDMTYVLDSDPRRRFTFGITAEDTTMRIWFCSRSTVAVTQPFDYFGKPDCLIRLVASLACATETQCGFDPTMRLVQGWEQTHPMYDIDVYTDPDTPPTTYRSRALLSDFGPHALRGRATRVFEVQLLVDGEPTGKFHALKDVWVDHDHETEGKLLGDIEATIAEEDKKAFERYFMTKFQHGYVFVPNEAGILVIDRAFTPTTVRGGQRCLSSKLRSSQPRNRTIAFSDKNHYRIVFKDVGTPVFQITSVKAVFKVLADIMTALEILHRAGWIHRNLSHHGIYLHNGDGKLSDLGFARKHTDDSRHEVRTGSAQFIAIEVELGRFRCALTPFRANGLHDIESSLWIAIWMVFFSISSVSPKLPALGNTITSKRLKVAYGIVYKERVPSMMERDVNLERGFQTLNPNVAFILPPLLKIRDSLARRRDMVGDALRDGTATIHDIHSLYTSVYSVTRSAFQQISDEAPEDLYLHFISPQAERTS